MRQRVDRLLSLMKERDIDVYIVPSEDFHQSEYVGEYFKARAWLSGFTGSAGTVVATAEEVCLWTDGRYFLQAEEQLKDTGIVLQKMGQPDVPTVLSYVKAALPEGGTLGFDGRVISVADGADYEKIAESKAASIVYNMDLIDELWEDRPAFSEKKAFSLPVEITGESAASKVGRVRKAIDEKDADTHILASLDDICWLLNMRGDDVLYSPLVLSYCVVEAERVVLFVDAAKLNDKIYASWEGIDVEILPYNDVYAFVENLYDRSILLDPSKMNYALYENIPADNAVIESANPTILMKAMKNDVELENMAIAHVKDGVAWTKFMYWIKHRIGKETITEIDASDKLEAFRKEQDGYMWPSFAPISGYAEHGAIVHYEADSESDKTLEPKGLYLSDTGANFREGSTDITRTLALGELTEEEIFHFTLVLKSHIGLARAVFPYGTHGYALDVLARKPFWENHLNFDHGTGHGIGQLLNIHEGPTGFRYKINPAKGEHHQIEPGMIITIEPGIYIAGKHGIRTENCIVVKETEANEYGQFMYFEPITLVPFDMDAVDVSMLDADEIAYLNAYNQRVFDTISPHLDEDEREWLKEYTKEI
ncbi:Xaa-Pro aminopeptidase [Peptoniphilus ivorii]|uniref:aminopeptidase P family protein n=1 Tax=Aedoeadaptatus ivorii TaxID=54006 RepID=UPI00278624FF|nr:aminopeptidase P family protein [Peptoniphilus ivorii]MDQ0507925.1 Xaa-Pro aminopeptidase [Peptoniphilus ivorii]